MCLLLLFAAETCCFIDLITQWTLSISNSKGTGKLVRDRVRDKEKILNFH